MHRENEADALVWIQQANCKGLTSIFFGHPSERPQAAMRREARAKLICEACPVFNQCRDYARTNREYGYWAGENEYDRAALGFGPNNARIRPATIEYYKRIRNNQESKHQ